MSEQKLDKAALEAFNAVTNKNYKEQAVFFLNAFWPEFEAAKVDKFKSGAEAVWNFYQTFLEVDKRQWEEVNKKLWKLGWKEGNSLDEFFSHTFLEKLGKTMTGIAFREAFRKIDVNFDKRMALTEFLLFDYNQTVAEMMGRPQADNKKEIDEAQERMAAVQKALEDLNTQLEQQKETVAAQKKAEHNAREAEAAAKAAEASARDALTAAQEAEAQSKASESKAQQAESNALNALQEQKAQEDAAKQSLAAATAADQSAKEALARSQAADAAAKHALEQAIAAKKDRR